MSEELKVCAKKMDEVLDTLRGLRNDKENQLDKRMLSEAITDFEKGSMCMIKSQYPGEYKASRVFEETK